MPFNTNSYTDVLIVLKQVFGINFFNDKDILNNIDIKFYFENIQDKDKKYLFTKSLFRYIIYITIILLLLFTFILFFYIYELCDIEEDINKNILDYANQSLKYSEESSITKPCIFNPFIDVFNGTKYYPSYFSGNLNGVSEFNWLNFLSEVSNIVDGHSTDLGESKIVNGQPKTMALIGRGLMARLREHHTLIGDIMFYTDTMILENKSLFPT